VRYRFGDEADTGHQVAPSIAAASMQQCLDACPIESSRPRRIDDRSRALDVPAGLQGPAMHPVLTLTSGGASIR
jgi:hypothetical protein